MRNLFRHRRSPKITNCLLQYAALIFDKGLFSISITFIVVLNLTKFNYAETLFYKILVSASIDLS